MVGALLFVRKPIAGLGYALPWPGSIAASGSACRTRRVTAFMLLAAIAIMTAPARPVAPSPGLLFAAAVLQIVIGVVATSHTADVSRSSTSCGDRQDSGVSGTAAS